LLEPLRAFALDRLKAHDEQHAAAHAHADHLLQQQGDLAWHDLPWVEAELDNVRAALRWAIDHAHTDTALRLILGVSWYLETNSLQREEVGLFEAALALPDGDGDLRLHALMRGATPAWQLGRHGQARDWLHAALPAVQGRPWPEGELLVRITLARVEIESGHPQAALLHLHAGLRLPPGGEGARASLLFHLADANVALGQPGRARAYVHEGLGVCREQPGLFWEAHLLTIQAGLDLDDGQVGAARASLARALELLASTLHSRILTLALSHLACTYATPAADHADLLRAARLWGLVEAQREASAQPLAVHHAGYLGRSLQAARRRVPEAAWRRAWESGRALGLREGWAESIGVLREDAGAGLTLTDALALRSG
ncbi:hypothetical protein, partial [Deinococcus sp.]|uniref:hypothetical protein n=1 Tax=Deinococcus sp. TaxID=47478 RepID=UPI002869A736